MSFSASALPIFSQLIPRPVDPLWHRVDAPRDEEADLTRMEKEHEARVKIIAKSYSDITPIGKTSQEPLDDDDDEDDDDDNDDNDDNDSDSHEDEDDVEMDMTFAGPNGGGPNGVNAAAAAAGGGAAAVPNAASAVTTVAQETAGARARVESHPL